MRYHGPTWQWCHNQPKCFIVLNCITIQFDLFKVLLFSFKVVLSLFDEFCSTHAVLSYFNLTDSSFCFLVHSQKCNFCFMVLLIQTKHFPLLLLYIKGLVHPITKKTKHKQQQQQPQFFSLS